MSLETLRKKPPAHVIAALDALGELDAGDERELIAIAYGHADDGVRKKAQKLVDKRVPDAKKLRATLKPGFVHEPEHPACARLRALDRKDRGKLASALVAYGTYGYGVAFDEDPDFARELLPKLVVKKERKLDLTDWADMPKTKGTWLVPSTIPDLVFDALPKLRKACAFDHLNIHGGNYTTLPARFAELAPFLTKLSLFYVDFDAMPDVVYACDKLESLELCAFKIASLGRIGKLKRLEHLMLHECKKLKALPPELFELPLESLHLSSMPLRSLPKEIGKLTKLRVLELQSSPIGKLPKEIANCPLERINIRWSKLDKAQVAALLPKKVKIEE